MGIYLNAVAAVGIAGSLSLGVMTTWNGGASLTAAKNKIVQEADALGVYHTNEGKLLNKISTLNAQISQLQISGNADQTQIASLQTQVNNLNTQLAQSGTNQNTLAQRADDLTAQLDQANSDATDLQSTVDNTTFTASDQASVDTATNGVTAPPTDTTTTASASVETQAAGSVQVHMLTGVPYAFTSDGQIKLNTLQDGTVVMTNAEPYAVTATVNGQSYTIPTDGTAVTIGDVNTLDQHNMTVTGQYNQAIGNGYFLIKN